MKSAFLEEALARGFFYQSTDLDGVDEYLSTNRGVGYIGFDATATSLHVGHMIPILLMRLFQKHGHKPLILVGGGTTKLGDPTFKNTARPLLTDEQIQDNIAGIKRCLMPFLKFGDDDAQILNNADWLEKLQYIPFLREIGRFFSVNRMISFDSVKSRLSDNNSMSFLEFNYMVLQGYDFYHLYKHHDCVIQFGGQDQWGNILNGTELIHKILKKNAFGFTVPLLTTSDGVKMGKTANGAVWLCKDLLSPYDFWQFWRNTNDADVIRMLYLFTDLPIAEIKRMESIQGAELNVIKVMLADEVTSIVHGRETLCEIHNTAAMAFGGNCKELSESGAMPCYRVQRSAATSVSLIDIATEMGLCESRGDAKRLLRGNGMYINDKPVVDCFCLNSDMGDMVKFSCGKKKHILIIFE